MRQLGRLASHISIGIRFFTCENIAHIEFYFRGLLPKIFAICTIKII